MKSRPSNAHEKKKTTPITREDHVLVMKPKSNKCKLTDIQNTSIANTLKSCPIINARTTKTGSAVIRFPTKEHLEKAKNQLKKKHEQQYTVERPQKMMPKMTLIDVPPDTDLESLKQEILDLNPNVKKTAEDDNLTFDLLFKYFNKDNGTNVVIKVHPTIRSILVQNGNYLFIPMKRLRVIDRTHFLNVTIARNSVTKKTVFMK